MVTSLLASLVEVSVVVVVPLSVEDSVVVVVVVVVPFSSVVDVDVSTVLLALNEQPQVPKASRHARPAEATRFLADIFLLSFV
jgi:hypothetical protein